jgi:hypothetical protein
MIEHVRVVVLVSTIWPPGEVTAGATSGLLSPIRLSALNEITFDVPIGFANLVAIDPAPRLFLPRIFTE